MEKNEKRWEYERYKNLKSIGGKKDYAPVT
jgi:hypothetical protein